MSKANITEKETIETVTLSESTIPDASSNSDLELTRFKSNSSTSNRNIIRTLAAIFMCLVIPITLYFPFRNDFRVYVALQISGIIPVMSVFHRLLFDRIMDPLGVFVVGEFVASMVVLLLPGTELDIATRKAWLAIGNAVVFLASMIPFQHLRPLLFYVFQDVSRVIASIRSQKRVYPTDRIVWAWENIKIYRSTVRSLNAMWILIFIITGAVRLALIYKHNPSADPEHLLHVAKLLSELPLGIAVVITVLIGGIGMTLLVNKHLMIPGFGIKNAQI
ncbi:hypothetical protein INT43_008988 [Umbelopsis isabellina]|uniref:Uncharacterized protein n=1 Tax=Mortierella isabellina TaxID=91625 RepID=A0A8H7PWX9_MORIS|nr:hypothetical protein INT43_008988 [Umbelopsis isabellina]